MCSASSLMGMGGWLIIPAWQQGSEVTQTSVEWPKLLQVGIAHMQRCENNYTDREHHTLRGSTLRQKINSDPCVRTKWGESSLLVNYFSLINCSLCDQRSNNSRENKHRQNTNYEACAHNTQHTTHTKKATDASYSHFFSQQERYRSISFKRQMATTINQSNTAMYTNNTIH